MAKDAATQQRVAIVTGASRGIGRQLVQRTHEAAGLHTTLILLAAPKARTYYRHIGMRPHESGWVIDRTT